MKFDIGIDGRMIRNTGIGTYLRGLTTHLSRINGRDKIGFFYQHKREEDLNFGQIEFRSPIYSLREQLGYNRFLKDCRLWHAPHFNIPFRKGRTKLVVTVHDLIPWIFKDTFFKGLKPCYFQIFLSRIVQIADHIIAVSNQTKKDLVDFFGANPDKISVIYEAVLHNYGPDHSAESWDKLSEKYGLKKPYFIYVGMIKPHKNILWLLDSFHQARLQKKIEADLVIVGSPDLRDPYAQEVYATIKSLPFVRFISNIAFEDLRTLYSNANALVHPSLYEGFGLTLLEAMSCGTPVLALKTGSIPEIAGNAAFLVNAQDRPAWTNALGELEQSRPLRTALAEKGLDHVRSFSWQKTAEQTLELYKKVLAQ